jgi:hypothetical protein
VCQRERLGRLEPFETLAVDHAILVLQPSYYRSTWDAIESALQLGIPSTSAEALISHDFSPTYITVALSDPNVNTNSTLFIIHNTSIKPSFHFIYQVVNFLQL